MKNNALFRIALVCVLTICTDSYAGGTRKKQDHAQGQQKETATNIEKAKPAESPRKIKEGNATAISSLKAKSNENSYTRADRIARLERVKIDPNKSHITTAKGAQSRAPRNLREQLLWEDTLRNPKAGTPLPDRNKDDRFPQAEGWMKYSRFQEVNSGIGLDLHYQYNDRTEYLADMKIEQKPLKSRKDKWR